MDSRFPVFREELYNVQMDVKQLAHAQSNHAERLARLEKHQANESAIKSAWNSPFPSAIGGTPQHGPLQMPPGDLFDDFDEEQGQNLLGSLHLDAEEEPVRRGAASRANSVRFDESALQGSSWAQNGRQSGEFAPTRPASGMGNMMERTLSHKSDGRHSSAGYSVHSVHSHHSVASGRGSSLGLDTNYATTGSEEDSPIDAPAPPPGFFILGSVPSIIRCWLTNNFAHETLLYADICSGSQQSVLDFSLIRDLKLSNEVHKDLDGVYRIRLPVYLTEATVTHPSTRNSSPTPQMPNLIANFEVIGIEQPENVDLKRSIRIFIGSETLREHSADIFFSQNRMTLYGSEREKLSVPFVRPEDQNVFKHIRTVAILPERPRLNATARPFVLNEAKSPAAVDVSTNGIDDEQDNQGTPSQELDSTASEMPSRPTAERTTSNLSDIVQDQKKQSKDEMGGPESTSQEPSISGDNRSETHSDIQRRDPTAGGIWSSWRQTPSANNVEQKDSAPLSGYQPAGRARNMKVLKPSKSSTSTSARTGAAYEPPPPPRTSAENRRKSQPLESTPAGVLRWGKNERASVIGSERTSAAAPEAKPTPTTRETRSVSATPRTSANPVGGASAFSWMTPVNKPKASATTAE
ncbi:ubiquitin carboxyl-terminal hydrolase 19 [Seiridium cupressi]